MPLVVATDCNGDPFVLTEGWVAAVRGHLRMAVAATLAWAACHLNFQEGLAHVGHEGFCLRQVYELPLTCAGAVVEGGVDGECRGYGGYGVGVMYERIVGEVEVGVAAQGGVSGHRVNRHAHAAVSAVGAGVAVAGGEEDDEVGLDLPKDFVAQAEPVHHAECVVGEDDVADGDEFLEGGYALLAGEVEGDAELVSICRVEVALPVPGTLAGVVVGIAGRVGTGADGAARHSLERFDLDDLGAHVAEQDAAEGACPDFGEFEGADAAQGRFLHANTPRDTELTGFTGWEGFHPHPNLPPSRGKGLCVETKLHLLRAVGQVRWG